jgi:hypothetical protein
LLFLISERPDEHRTGGEPRRGLIGAEKMLSHIVTLMNSYERNHGVRPNVVYMNETHYGYLREELPFVRDHNDVIAILGIDIALNDEAMNPQAATVRFASENILVS